MCLYCSKNKKFYNQIGIVSITNLFVDASNKTIRKNIVVKIEKILRMAIIEHFKN